MALLFGIITQEGPGKQKTLPWPEGPSAGAGAARSQSWGSAPKYYGEHVTYRSRLIGLRTSGGGSAPGAVASTRPSVPGRLCRRRR